MIWPVFDGEFWAPGRWLSATCPRGSPAWAMKMITTIEGPVADY